MQERKSRSTLLPLLALSIITLALSCKSPRTIAENRAAGNCNLRSYRKDSLLTLLKKNEFQFDWITAKLNASVMGADSSEQTFTINMRARKDSAIWLSISKLGIEGARALITKDSVKLIQHIPDNKYFKGDYAYLNKLLQAELDFEMVQAVLFGNSVEFYEDERYRSSVDTRSCEYLMSTIRKRRLRRAIQGSRELKEPVQSIWLKPDNNKISRIFFFDADPNRTFEARFDKFTAVDSTGLLPMLMKYDIKAEGAAGEKRVTINIEYVKITLSKPQTFPFNIPSGYEQISTREK